MNDCQNCGNALYRNGAAGPCSGCTDFNKWEAPQAAAEGQSGRCVCPSCGSKWCYSTTDKYATSIGVVCACGTTINVVEEKEPPQTAPQTPIQVVLDYLKNPPPAEKVLFDSFEDSALATQVGGSHYKDMPIQPVEFIHKNGIGFCEGAAIKYLSRWRAKGGVEDLRKARHFIDLLIEMETK